MPKMTGRQTALKKALLEFNWDNYSLHDIDQAASDEWARDLALQLDKLITGWLTPALRDAQPAGLHPDIMSSAAPATCQGYPVVFDLDRFYQEVVMPSRERYMEREADKWDRSNPPPSPETWMTRHHSTPNAVL